MPCWGPCTLNGWRHRHACCPAGFTPKNAVALSNITIMGGALANLMFNIRRRHATADRPLIDWDLILVMEPATILGAVFGGFLNKVPSVLSTL